MYDFYPIRLEPMSVEEVNARIQQQAQKRLEKINKPLEPGQAPPNPLPAARLVPGKESPIRLRV